MTNSGLIAINPLTLVPNYLAGTNMFIWNENTETTVKFLSSEQMVTESTFSFLLANPGQKVFVEDSSYQSYQEYLIENLESWLVEPRIPRILKTTVITECFHGRFTRAFQKKSVRDLVECSMECSLQLAQIGHHIQIDGRELQRTLRHDASFVTHAVNTAFYSYLIAENRGYCEKMITEVCVGAMMHDVGKIEPWLLDCNSDSLSETRKDWTNRNGQSHPIEGFRRLCNEPGITETHLLMCYQHHERLDGKGFPVGLISEEIHEASKICAVANRFEGLTSDCSHRQAMTRLAAFRVLESEKKIALDSEMIQCLNTKMSHCSTT